MPGPQKLSRDASGSDVGSLVHRNRDVANGGVPENGNVEGHSSRIGGIAIDRQSGKVFAADRPVHLAPIEYKILELLMLNPGLAFSRERLAEAAWGEDTSIDIRTVDQKIRRIRSALNRGPAPDPIRSVRGKGYKFSETYERDYAIWLRKGKKRLHISEILQKRKRMSKSISD